MLTLEPQWFLIHKVWSLEQAPKFERSQFKPLWPDTWKVPTTSLCCMLDPQQMVLPFFLLPAPHIVKPKSLLSWCFPEGSEYCAWYSQVISSRSQRWEALHVADILIPSAPLRVSVTSLLQKTSHSTLAELLNHRDTEHSVRQQKN